MPIQDDTSVLSPLDRVSNLDTAAHATCPPEDDCPTSTLQNPTASYTADPANPSLRNGLANIPAASHAQAEEPQASAAAAELPAPLTRIPTISQSPEDTSVVAQDTQNSTTAERLVKRYDGTSLKAAATSSSHAHASPLPPPPRQALTPPNAPVRRRLNEFPTMTNHSTARRPAYLLLFKTWQQVRRNPTVGSTGLQRHRRAKACGHARVVSVRVPAHRGHVSAS